MNKPGPIYSALAALAKLLQNTPAKWIVGGSAGLLLRGLPLSAMPRDIDIYCDEADMDYIYSALKQYAVDYPHYSETNMYRSTLVHFEIEDMPIELVGGFQVHTSSSSYEVRVSELLIPYGESVSVAGCNCTLMVVPLAHELWFNQLRGREDRVELIAKAFVQTRSIHVPALQAIEKSNHFTAADVNEVHQIISLEEAGEVEWTQR